MLNYQNTGKQNCLQNKIVNKFVYYFTLASANWRCLTYSGIVQDGAFRKAMTDSPHILLNGVFLDYKFL